MIVHQGFEGVNGIRNAVVTTGSFDGVHVGHKTIIKRINEIARSINGQSVLITFHPHPRKVLYPETRGKELKFILSQREKIEFLSQTGLDHLIIVNFTLEFSRVSSEEFVKHYLIDLLKAKYIVVGFNHHFGHNGEGDYSYLDKLGREVDLAVEEIPEQDIHNETVSSTTIRKAIREGRIQRANAYLDNHFILIGALGKGSHMFAEAGFPTLTVQIDETGKLIPPDGIYAVSLVWNGTTYKAMAIIWSDKTNTHPGSQVVEVHILDFDNTFHKADGKLLFQKRITSGVNNDNPNRLKQQLNRCRHAVNDLIY